MATHELPFPTFAGWECRFWDILDSRGSPWAKQMSESDRWEFQTKIEEMLAASMSAGSLEALWESWLTVPVDHDWFQDGDFLCETAVNIRNPSNPLEKDVETVIECSSWVRYDPATIDWKAVRDTLPLFVQKLKAFAMSTAENFVQASLDYMATLPSEVVDHLRKNLVLMALFQLLYGFDLPSVRTAVMVTRQTAGLASV